MGQAQDQNFIWVVRAEGAGLGRYPIWRLSGVSDGPRGQNEGILNFDGRTSRVGATAEVACAACPANSQPATATAAGSCLMCTVPGSTASCC